jgi:hypothetical protein
MGSEMESPARQKMQSAPPPVVADLEGRKAERFNAKTMLIPSPLQVQEAISQIPPGETKTVLELRQELAAQSNADVTCPRTMTICWQLVAEVAEEDRDENNPTIAPWWRVTREGKSDPKMPGGRDNHQALLRAEGINI